MITKYQNYKQFYLTMDDEETEYEFFKLLVLCAIVEQPRLFISRLTKKDPWEMYMRAKGIGQGSSQNQLGVNGTINEQHNRFNKRQINPIPLEFYQFYDWILNDINNSIYNEDAFKRQSIYNKANTHSRFNSFQETSYRN